MQWGKKIFAFAMAAFLVSGCERKKPAPPPQPVAVIAAKVLVHDQLVYSEFIGQTRGSQEIEVRARVEGVLESIHFQEGLLVKKDDLLYTIDRKPYEAAVAEAQGQLARAEADWINAGQNKERLEPLIKKNAVSRQQYDDAVATEKANRAAVESAKAAVESAQLRLGYTTITAPAGGRIGKSEVQPGNLVGSSQSTLLTIISAIDPIDVRFSISENEYLEWTRAHPNESQDRRLTTNLFRLILSDFSHYPYPGSLVFADRNIDIATGTLLIEVSFPNPNNLLRPGQYTRVLFPKILTNAIMVPQRAVQELQATYNVFVVTPDNKAEVRSVKPGARAGDLWIITSGLKTNEVVVVEGLQKLRPGVSVRPTMIEITPEQANTKEEKAPAKP